MFDTTYLLHFMPPADISAKAQTAMILYQLCWYGMYRRLSKTLKASARIIDNTSSNYSVLNYLTYIDN